MQLLPKEHFAAMIYNHCAVDPKYVKIAIKAATDGVEKFADNQKDRAGGLSAILVEYVEKYKTPTQHFDIDQILDALRPAFGSSEMMNKLEKELLK